MRGVNPKAAECVTNPATLHGQLKPGDQVLDARHIFQDQPLQLVA